MNSKTTEQLLLSEIQVLLAEKRTYFAILRTGLAIISVPLTVILFLVATTSYHHLFDFAWISIIIVSALFAISVTGAYLSYASGRKIRRINQHIRDAEKANKRIDDIIV